MREGAESADPGIHPWVLEGERRVRLGIVHPLIAGGGAEADVHEQVLAAEELGVDGYWFSDHPMLNPDPWIRLASLAPVTRTIRLGTIVTCIYYRHPAVLARMVADVDRLSGGRVVLGLGIGDFADEFAQLGLPFPPTGARLRALDEALAIIVGLLAGEPVDVAGEQFSVHGARVDPPPVQRPHVPLLIAGAGERVTLRQVAQYADASNFGPNPHTGNVLDADAVRAKLRVLDAHCAARGRDPRAILRTYWSPPMLLGRTAAEARRKADTLTSDEHRFYGDQMLVGTPTDAVRRLRPLVAAGLRYLIVHTRADLDTARLLVDDVLPELQAAPGG